MRKRNLFCVYLILLSTAINAQTNTFKVMAWNIPHGANDIKNGKENVVKSKAEGRTLVLFFSENM